MQKNICVGDIVATSYGTGPYYIAEIHGPCTSPHFLDQINGVDRDSEPHYYFRCGWAGSMAEGHNYQEDYHLNGYRLDGSSVWSNDHLVVVGHKSGIQLDLLAEAT